MKAARRRGAPDQREIPQLVQTMQGMLPDLSGKKRQAAEYFFSHPDHVAFMSLRKIALAARVSTGIVMKLLQDVGYQSYETFRADFQRWVTGRYNYFGAVAETAARDPSRRNSLLDKIAENDIENIRRTVAGAPNIAAAADAILQARKVFVVGMRVTASIAIYLTYQINFIRENVLLLSAANEMLVDQLADVGPNDVLIPISFFPYTSSTIASVRHAEDRGAKVISITDRESAPITSPGGITLLFGVESPWIFNSITAGLMLAQAIVAECLAKEGKSALTRINDRDRLLKSFSIFDR